MKKIRLLAPLAVLAFLLVGSSVKAEVLQVCLQLNRSSEIPSSQYIFGSALITIFVERDLNGRVIGGTVKFTVNGADYSAGTSEVTVTGLNVREGHISQNGRIVITTGLNESNSRTLDAGGDILLDDISATGIDVEALRGLIKNPPGFYLELTTERYPGGLMRGQIPYLTELRATTVNLSPANEVPRVEGSNATAAATATITTHLARNAETGSVSNGFVNFTVTYDFPGPVTITGLDLHEAASGQNGPTVIRAGVSESNPIVSETGKGTINLNAPLTTAGDVATLNRLVANPAGFYVNLHTSTSPIGAIRAQLASLSLPPLIAWHGVASGVNGRFGILQLWVLNLDLASSVVIDGQPVPTIRHLESKFVKVQLPATLTAKPGILVVQVQNAQGVLSEPINIVVYYSLNSTGVTPVDGARFRSLLARDSICAAFGSGLSTNTVSASSTPLPTSLDGTSVYVNGLLAPLFFVSPTQVNFQIPYNVDTGFLEVLVVARDGTVSRGYTSAADTAPAIFTRLANGQGAPAAYASADGVNFNVEVSNADGSAAAVNAGVYVSLYGTGIRYTSGPVLVSIGGTSVKAMFAGPQGTFIGLDQVNFQIPTSLAGKGEVEMLIYVDGEASNPVKLNIR